jgi:hypothetical protein
MSAKARLIPRRLLPPTSLKIDAGAAPYATLVALVVVLGVAVLVIGPALALLFTHCTSAACRRTGPGRW